MSSNWIKIVVLGCFLLGISFSGISQSLLLNPTSNSPFSRFGIGDFFNQYTAQQAGMAGLTTANISPYHLNLENPAALSYLQATSFQVGISARYSAYKEEGNSENVWSGFVNYIALGFPLINPVNKILDRDDRPISLGMAFSLRPYTTVGYDILTNITPQDFPEVGSTSNSFKGSGGTYRLMWSNSFRYKSLSAGFSVGAIFGTITNNTRISLDSIDIAYVSEFQEDIGFGGWLWEAGLLYTLNLNEVKRTPGGPALAGRQKRITFGLTGNSNNYITTRTSSFQFRDNARLLDLDTIDLGAEVRNQAVLPTEISLGITYEKVNQLKLGVEYSVGLWDNFESSIDNANLANNYRIALGGEYTPNIASIRSYFDKVRYRFGAFYGTDPRVIGGEQLENYGLTLGIGFPMIRPRETVSYFNFAIELGQFGVTDILTETYVKLTVGFSLNDNSWFFKRKFD